MRQDPVAILRPLAVFRALPLVALGCVGTFDPVSIPNPCDNWRGSNADLTWLIEPVRISEIASYLEEKDVECRTEILQALSEDLSGGAILWEFRNPNLDLSNPAEGYAAVRGRTIETSFFKSW